MATMRIKKGDTVQVIAGKDKGKSGKVISVDYDKKKVVGLSFIIVYGHLFCPLLKLDKS